MVILSELTNNDLFKNTCWRVIQETIDDEDVTLEPANLSDEGKVLAINGEVWCKGLAKFKNGLTFTGACMCRADSSDGPLLITVWNGHRDVSLIMPPAPDFVLAQEGPVPFCNAFDLIIDDVFPIQFNVEPEFEIEPFFRAVILS